MAIQSESPNKKRKPASKTSTAKMPLTSKALPDTVGTLLAQAEAGDRKFQQQLGSMYYAGSGAKQDHKKAAYWFSKAADQGMPVSQFNLGIMYRNGVGVTASETAAIKWFKKAAEQGDAQAAHRLGKIYEQGEGNSRNMKKAVEWYQTAAKLGNAKAKSRLEQIAEEHISAYNNGDYKEDIIDIAVDCYKFAAKMGDVKAKSRLEQIAEEGVSAYNNGDYKKAYGMIASLAKSDKTGEFFRFLAIMHLKEDGTPTSVYTGLAHACYLDAAFCGNATAMYEIAQIHEGAEDSEDGDALLFYKAAKDHGHAEAAQRFALLAREADPDALCDLGCKYRSGKSKLVTQNYVEAVEWFSKAADQGDWRACGYFGAMYEKGQGLTKDLGKAYAWTLKAAREGARQGESTQCRSWKSIEYSGLLFRLGKMSFLGEGTNVDYRLAAQWFQKAEDLGDCIIGESALKLLLAGNYEDLTIKLKEYNACYEY